MKTSSIMFLVAIAHLLLMILLAKTEIEYSTGTILSNLWTLIGFIMYKLEDMK